MHGRLGIGVCGARIARNHIKGFKLLKGIDVLCVAGPDIDRCRQVAEEFGVPRVVADYREMLEMQDIDAVSVCVPNLYHPALAIDALNAGKHVLCEKPLAINAREAQRIVDAARANDRLLMVAFNNRFAGNVRALKAVIDEGTLGPIHCAKAYWLRRHGIPGFGGWFTTKSMSGGGPLIDIGVHMMDLALYMMGYPEPVAVTGATYSKFGPRGMGAHPGWGATDLQITNIFDVEDLAVGMVKFANGATLMAESSWAGHQGLEDDLGIQLFGRDGGARIYMPNYKKDNSVQVYTEAETGIADFSPVFTLDDEYAREVRHFVDCIREGKESLAPGEQGVTVMRIIDALYESAATGSEVHLKEPVPSGS